MSLPTDNPQLPPQENRIESTLGLVGLLLCLGIVLYICVNFFSLQFEIRALAKQLKAEREFRQQLPITGTNYGPYIFNLTNGTKHGIGH